MSDTSKAWFEEDAEEVILALCEARYVAMEDHGDYDLPAFAVSVVEAQQREILRLRTALSEAEALVKAIDKQREEFFYEKKRAEDALAAAEERERELRRRLFPYADTTEIGGMSWNGFNLIGDKKSINEVQRLENRSSQIDVFRAAFDERVAIEKARANAAEEREKRLRAFATIVRLTDWGWQGGGSDVRVLGKHGRLASKLLGLEPDLPLGWPGDAERSELRIARAALEGAT